MTKSQKLMIERLDLEVESHGYEVEEKVINEHQRFISYLIMFKYKNDGKSSLRVIQLFIGKRGGVTYPLHKKVNGENIFYEKRYKEDLFTVALEQNEVMK